MNKRSIMSPVSRLNDADMEAREEALCFIVETENSAGIFLSDEVGRLLSVNGMEFEIEPFARYSDAEEELLGRYPDLGASPIILNRLYWAKEKQVFSVFDFGDYAVATSKSESAWQLAVMGNKVGTNFLFENGLSFDEAQDYFWSKITKLMELKFPMRLFDLPVEDPVFFSQIIELLEQEKTKSWE